MNIAIFIVTHIMVVGLNKINIVIYVLSAVPDCAQVSAWSRVAGSGSGRAPSTSAPPSCRSRNCSSRCWTSSRSSTRSSPPSTRTELETFVILCFFTFSAHPLSITFTNNTIITFTTDIRLAFMGKNYNCIINY